MNGVRGGVRGAVRGGCPSESFSLGSFYADCPHLKTHHIMKVYMERKNMQCELIRFRKKYRIYSGFLCRTDEVNATRSRVYAWIVITA